MKQDIVALGLLLVVALSLITVPAAAGQTLVPCPSVPCSLTATIAEPAAPEYEVTSYIFSVDGQIVVTVPVRPGEPVMGVFPWSALGAHTLTVRARNCCSAEGLPQTSEESAPTAWTFAAFLVRPVPPKPRSPTIGVFTFPAPRP